MKKKRKTLLLVLLAGVFAFWWGMRAAHPPRLLPTETSLGVFPGWHLGGVRPLSGVDKAPRATITAADRAKLATLDSILASKNDNDPRLDKDFKHLSEGAKQLLRERYEKEAAEGRNERGTIVYLLGRNLTTKGDFDFLDQVLAESPCLSLERCDRAPAGSSAPEDLHHEAGYEVTLAYPQLVALKMAENFLEGHGSGSSDSTDLRERARQTVRTARNSRNPKVAEIAGAIAGRL